MLGVYVLIEHGKQSSIMKIGYGVAGPQLKNPSDCLLKTQVSANTKVDV